MTEETLQHLAVVDAERQARAADPALAARVAELKRYQQCRFEQCYADLLASDRYAQAARFFLQELYGPTDFVERDRQFARIVPKIAAMMPAEVSATVGDLARLHAISERLDSKMAQALPSGELGPVSYVRAWQRVGQEAQRTAQIELVLAIGAALDRFTRRTWILAALRLMRGPAHAAGLAALQAFLESGMESFRSMRGAGEFLAIVRERETALMRALFDTNLGAISAISTSGPLQKLPAGS
ncbi:MAG: hypothetical protein QM750_17300 [Rubrivivax sp.]